MLEDLGIWAPILVTAGIYALFAVGLQVQVAYAGLDNFGQVGFMAIGAYTMAIQSEMVGRPLWLSVVIAIGASMLAALVVALPTVRLRGDFLAIVAIAASEIIRNVFQNTAKWGGPKGTESELFRIEIARPILRWARENDYDIDRTLPLLMLVWVSVLVTTLLAWAMLRTPWGRVLRAVREDEDAARALGKNAFLYKLQGMMFGAAFAGLAGVYYAFNQVQFSPSGFEPIVTFTGFVIIIIAGLGSLSGTVLASIFMVGLLEGTRYLDTGLPGDKDAALRYMVVGLVLMLIVAFRPQGVFGKRQEMVLDD